MNTLYHTMGVSKQAVHQHRNDEKEKIERSQIIFQQADVIRLHHPRMGVRKMYPLIHPDEIGRDKFEALMLGNGYRVHPVRNRIKTTRRHALAQYPNLIAGKTLTDINQVWASDITYMWTSMRWYYVTFIEDVYSRRILGYHPSRSLRAEANIIALVMALSTRGITRYKDLIHHSDRGGQYIDKEYLAILARYGIQISMCDTPQENAYVERLNGTMKYEYFACYQMHSHADVCRTVARSVELYNMQRPHLSLFQQMSPVQFENYVVSLPDQEKPTVKIYTDGSHEEVG